MFPSMVEIVPESQYGIAKIEHFEVNRSASRLSSMRPDDYVPEGRYAKLKVNGRLTMSDTMMEHRTNREVVWKAKGNVLIAGLGIGMILHPILAKSEVTSVTVIEKYPDVIALVAPTIKSDKLTIIAADIYEWKPAKGVKFDAIYFDIWAEQSTDCLEDMRRLHLRFRAHKNKDGWMDSWRREYLRAEKRRSSW